MIQEKEQQIKQKNDKIQKVNQYVYNCIRWKQSTMKN